MNSLIEKGLINEMQCGSNFTYILSDDCTFLTTEYKVLQSQESGCFIKCMKMLYNGKTQLYYLTNSYKPFLSLIPSLDAESFITIVTNLLSDVIEVKNNGFLSCQNVDISFEHIYVEPTTYKVKLVYLPVSNHLFSEYSFFENELRTSLIKIISGVSTLSSPKTMQLASDLSNGMYQLSDLYRIMKGGKVQSKGFESQSNGFNTKLKDQIFDISSNSTCRIVAMNAPTRVEIQITKDEFIIGKKPELVDGVVSFNKMISRKHCKITRQNGNYYLIDLASANGTFVNGERLQPHTPHLIKNGDIIKMANSDFQIAIN